MWRIKVPRLQLLVATMNLTDIIGLHSIKRILLSIANSIKI